MIFPLPRRLAHLLDNMSASVGQISHSEIDNVFALFEPRLEALHLGKHKAVAA